MSQRHLISVILTGSVNEVDAYADMLHDLPGTDVSVEYVGVEDYEDED